MTYRFVSDLSPVEYQAFAYDHPLYNIYQSLEWAQIKKEWEHLFVGVYQEEELVLVSLVLYRCLPMNYTLFYIPKGPLANYDDQKLMRYFFEKLKELAVSKKAIYIKIAPNILLSSVAYKDINNHKPVRENKFKVFLEALGYKHHGFNLNMYDTAQPRYCAAYYYDEKWPANYSNKAVKAVEKALKKGVEIKYLTSDQLPLFADIMSYTEKRKNISLRNQEYYQRIVDAYKDNVCLVVSTLNLKAQLEQDKTKLSELKNKIEKRSENHRKSQNTVDQINNLEKEVTFKEQAIKQDGEIAYISCLLAVKIKGTTEMLYAGMNEKYRKYYGSYLSYFEGIKWAHEKGCYRCDFGGIQGTLDDGLTEFKGYFEPNIEEYIGEFDLIINKPINFIFDLSLKVFKSIRRLLRGIKR
ncbi:MAG: peptidoglycan bridge formation glycyltransferase FemA/FemB family protein [Erysipelotrichaceae bacterium]|nr:peptidoglycan bridge formation glycyltransferase FemA/FemB family protein [Erysipelotrichaceae bacterium]